MLEKEGKRKFLIICPHCQREQSLTDWSWLCIFDDLDRFGKTVVCCKDCRIWYIIRDDGDGPFVTK